MRFTVGLIVVLLLIAGGTYWYLKSHHSATMEEVTIEEDIPKVEPKPVPQEVPEEPVAEPEPVEAVSQPELPSLNESDSTVLSKLKPLLTHPVFEDLFHQKEIIRNWVVAIDRLSRGENAYRQLSYLHPAGSFEPDNNEGVLLLGDKNYRRTLPLIEGLNRLPQAEVMELYRIWEPWILEAYGELGNADSWGESLGRLMERIEQFSYPPEPIELIGSNGVYIFSDPQLEELPSLEKALIRMGPEQVKQIQKLSKSYFLYWQENFPKKNIDKP